MDDHVAGEAGLRRVVARRHGSEQQRQRDARCQDGNDGEQQKRPVLPRGWETVFA